MALLVVGQDLSGMSGVAFLGCAHDMHPQAVRVLPVERDYSARSPIVAAMTLGQERRSRGSPLLDGLQPLPFTALRSAFDALYPAGLQWYWKTDFFRQISDEAIDVHARYGAQLPTGHSTMHLYPVDGAASRVAADATAFPHRDGGWPGVIVGVDPDPANARLITGWAQDYWRDLHPATAGGGYVNFLMNEGQDRVRDSYRGNYDRLARIKGRYDPDNTFRINQNIQAAR